MRSPSLLPASSRPPALSLELDQQPDLTLDLAVEGGFLTLDLGPPVGQRGEQSVISSAAGRGLGALVKLALLDYELLFLGDEPFEPLAGLVFGRGFTEGRGGGDTAATAQALEEGHDLDPQARRVPVVEQAEGLGGVLMPGAAPGAVGQFIQKLKRDREFVRVILAGPPQAAYGRGALQVKRLVGPGPANSFQLFASRGADVRPAQRHLQRFVEDLHRFMVAHDEPGAQVLLRPWPVG